MKFRDVYSFKKQIQSAQIWGNLLLAGVVLSLVFQESFNSLFNILFILLALFTGNWRLVKQKFKEHPIWLGMVFFFLAYVVAALYSSNVSYAWSKVQIKTMLWAMPLAFALAIERVQLKLFRKYLVVLPLIFALACFLRAVFRYYGSSEFSGNLDVFFYYRLSAWIMHPNYMMLYFGGAMFVLLDSFIEKKRVFTRKWDMILFFILTAFSFLLLQARTGVVIFSFLVAFRLIFLTGKWWRNRIIWMRIGIFSFFTLLFWISLPEQVKKRYKIDTSTEYVADDEKDTSVSGRLVIWKHCVACIAERPLFGFGTGDGVPRLHRRFQETNFEKGIEDKYNCHNQYLDSYMATGILGILALIWIIYFAMTGFFSAEKSITLLLFVVFFFGCMTFESLFERHKGIMAFVLFVSYLSATNNAEKIINKEVK